MTSPFSSPEPDNASDRTLAEQGMAELRQGRRTQARHLLLQAVEHDPQNEQAWLWLASAVASDAERRYCIERVLALDPLNTAARVQLDRLPDDLVPVSPLDQYQPSAASELESPTDEQPVSPPALVAPDSLDNPDSAPSASEPPAEQSEPPEPARPSRLKAIWDWLWETPTPKKAATEDEALPAQQDTDAPDATTGTTRTVSLPPEPPAADPMPATSPSEHPTAPPPPVPQPPNEPPAAAPEPAEPPRPRIILTPARASEEQSPPDPVQTLREMQPWFTILVRTKEIIQQLVKLNPPNIVILLAMLGGINITLDLRFYALPFLLPSGVLSPGLSVLLAVIFGPFLGIAILYVWGAALRWAGDWLYDRRVSAVEMRMAIAWSAVPSIATLLLVIGLLIVPLLDNTLFSLAQLVLYGCIEIAMGVWSLLLFLRCLEAIAAFSRKQALYTTLLAGLAVWVPLLFVALVFWLAFMRSF